MLLNWIKTAQGGAQRAAAGTPDSSSSSGIPPSAAEVNKLARDLWREGRSERRSNLGGTSAQASQALDFITEAGLTLGSLRSFKLGKDLKRHKSRYWLGALGDQDAIRLSGAFSRRLHRYINQWRDDDEPGRLFKEGNNKLALKPLREQLDEALRERFNGTLTLKQLSAYAQEGTYTPSQPSAGTSPTPDSPTTTPTTAATPTETPQGGDSRPGSTDTGNPSSPPPPTTSDPLPVVSGNFTAGPAVAGGGLRDRASQLKATFLERPRLRLEGPSASPSIATTAGSFYWSPTTATQTRPTRSTKNTSS